MIIGGIDEAGYGPLLGPLVVGCCAFEVDTPPGDMPCLWARLRKLVSKNRLRSGKKIHINDSKAVYNPSIGLRELERSVLAVIAAQAGWRETLEDFFTQAAPRAMDELKNYSWYQAGRAERFPIEQDATAIRLFANGLRHEMERTGTRCVHYDAHVLGERELNRRLKQTRNKSSLLFSVAAMHLDHLLRNYGARDLVIFCDRQGGREHYGHLLRLMFDEWSLEILREADGWSEYRLIRSQHAVRIIFTEKAEAQCLSVAAASMLSKYLREALMRRFNSFWKGHLPTLEPTAGYYSDGVRFLKDIHQKRTELGISDDQLVRCR